MKLKTFWLQGALVLVDLGVFVLGVFVFPHLPASLQGEFSLSPLLSLIFTGGIYLSAIAFYFASYEAWKILKNVASFSKFSKQTAIALRKMKWEIFAMSLSYCLLLPTFYIIGDIEDAPGIILFSGAIVVFPLLMSLFLGVLQELFERATLLQEENDATI